MEKTTKSRHTWVWKSIQIYSWNKHIFSIYKQITKSRQLSWFICNFKSKFFDDTLQIYTENMHEIVFSEVFIVQVICEIYLCAFIFCKLKVSNECKRLFVYLYTKKSQQNCKYIMQQRTENSTARTEQNPIIHILIQILIYICFNFLEIFKFWKRIVFFAAVGKRSTAGF